MNAIKAVQDYIEKMVANIQGMKVLVFDAYTVCAPFPPAIPRFSFFKGRNH
jgi:hypothetical protein